MSDLGQTRDWQQRCEAAEAERDKLIREGLTDLTNCARMLNDSEAEVKRLREALEAIEVEATARMQFAIRDLARAALEETP